MMPGRAVLFESMSAPDPALFLPDKLTPVAVEQLIAATYFGHRTVMGAPPPAPCLAVEVAQECLETGNGQHLHWYEVGNKKWAPDWDGHWTMFRCSEVVGGKVVWFEPPPDGSFLAACAFRANLSAEDGCAEQVKFLATRDRYRKAWGLIYAGKADAAVRELGRAGYFTANVDAYARAVLLIYGHLLEPCAAYVAGRSLVLDPELRGRVEGLVLESLYDPALRDLRLGEDLAA